MKVSPKKREHQLKRNSSLNFTAVTSTTRYRTMWYSGSIALYLWYLYWISRDIFIWHKPLAQISMLNYVGSIASIALIWIGTKLWKSNQVKPQKLRKEPPQPKPQPRKQTSTDKSSCTHYFGYLHQRKKSSDIPAECLTCEKVIQCFSTKK